MTLPADTYTKDHTYHMKAPYVQVYLLNACEKPLTYALTDNADTQITAGSILLVPVQKRQEYAIVIRRTDEPACDPSTVRTVSTETPIVQDAQYMPFIEKLCRYYAISRHTLFRRIRQSLGKKRHTCTNITQGSQKQTSENETTPQALQHEQQQIVDQISPHIHEHTFYPALVHGVTGSGKTHVYIALARACIASGKACVWLAPEVTLAIELANRVTELCPDIPCYNFHSATSAREKRAVWHALRNQEPCIIIGVHLPTLLPIAHLGCIIVDEEHDLGFQEKKHPKINSKEAAIMRASIYQIPIVLGSATPSMQALYNVEQGVWHKFQLTQRYSGTIAPITIAYLTQKERRTSFWITKTLSNAIEDRLARNEQTLIFLNRRGYNFFLRCGGCGHTMCCTHCSVSLTPHHTQALRCHYCDRTWPEPQTCPRCQAAASQFIRKGIGTQQAVTILQKLFPQARVARADLDTTVNRTRWQDTMTAFEAGDIDILVGTQTITKGYHFPNVTLVGLLWADINLGMPVYNTAERTLQQIIQVAGRAGRGDKTSHVIAQVMLDHELLAYAHEMHYQAYYAHEMQFRRELGYPPCRRFAAIELRHTDETTIDTDADRIAQRLTQTYTPAIEVLGPTQPSVSRIENTHMRTIYIKSDSFQAIYAAYTHISKLGINAQTFLTPNPTE